jgi:hypothetical protein
MTAAIKTTMTPGWGCPPSLGADGLLLVLIVYPL